MSNADRDLIKAGYQRVAFPLDQSGALPQAEVAIIDAGLRAYMLHVYNYMALGFVVTGLAALGICCLAVTDTLPNATYVIRGARVIAAGPGMPLQARDILLTNAGYTVFVSPLKWVIIFAPVALVFAASFGSARVQARRAHALFWSYAVLIGLSLGSVFLIFTHTSIVRVFFLAAAAFGALSLWALTSRRNLTGTGAFLVIGLAGSLIAAAVNLVLQSSWPQWLVSVIGIALLSGFTAWNTRRLENEYLYGAIDGDVAEASAIAGALSLYANVVALFLYPLQLFGRRDR